MMKIRLPKTSTLQWILDVAVQLLIFLYIGSYFSPEHLFSRNTTSGGDTASHYYTAQYLKDYLLPHFKILGWMQGNFAGFPVFQFYFPLPFVLMVLLSPAIGLQIAFKIVTVLGVFLLPICSYFGFLLLGFRFPTPSLAALFSLPFLFMEANSMWGGNIPSTLAGEFTNSIGLALMVLFAGSCYRGIHENRWAIRNAMLLALVGFSHGYTLLFAGAFSTYYLLTLPGLAKNIKYLLKVHVLAFCLMGFWIIPLLRYSPFTTRYNFIWVINSWKEILPSVLWPGIGLAAAFTLYKVVRMIWRPWREAFDHRVGLLWYILGLSYLFYLIAFRIHVVDIRFLPFLQLYLMLLGAVPLGLLAPRLRAGWMVLAIMALGTVLWTDHNVTFIRQWIAWNYSGFENKTLWPAFSGVNNALKGTEASPRVVYEHSADHNAAGTVRAFESIPLFSGRNTLEGLYMQSSISSPFVFYIQSEISEVTSCPLPDYHCSTLNLQRGADHLRLFNVSDFIVRSDAVKRAIRNSPDFEFNTAFPPYELYRVKKNENRYVMPLQYQPVLLQTQEWKMDFYNWFKRPNTSAVHLVHLFGSNSHDATRFPIQLTQLPDNIPQVALDFSSVQVTEQISQEEIRITTNKIGHPLLIKISYHPRWRVEGADSIYLASPSFMLIYPSQNNVRLVFGDPPLVRFGQLLSAFGLLCILGALPFARRRLKPFLERKNLAWERFIPSGFLNTWIALTSWYDRQRVWLAPTLICVSGLAILLFAFSLQQTDSSVLYNQGLELFSKQQYDRAVSLFEKATQQNPNSPSAINANYYYAICYFKQNQWEKAMGIFKDMIRKYPDSVYVPEAHYHVALCLQNLGQSAEALSIFQSIIDQYPASPWSGHARTQMNAIASPKNIPASVPRASGVRGEYEAAIAMYDQNRLQEAEQAFRAIVDKYPQDDLADDAYMHYVFTFFRREMYSQSIKELKIMIEKYPSSIWIPEAHYHIGISLMRQGQAAQAKAEFEWVIKNAPGSRWSAFSKERLGEIK